ncbi:hypothetical protein FUT87_02670 [Mitsuaria sp. TWR114]|uniref:hypothetical protein n=1 Tax=Mitsuaria sp. TWR114 TaxID=2601731 RepID=UPI0011BE4B6E|nr:hypothetical protein [Mitsuaria sp. TWR114]TXD99476.1 hypothetical protein FUT87_02670 [Mitsuaria sp. TWR114]
MHPLAASMARAGSGDRGEEFGPSRLEIVGEAGEGQTAGDVARRPFTVELGRWPVHGLEQQRNQRIGERRPNLVMLAHGLDLVGGALLRQRLRERVGAAGQHWRLKADQRIGKRRSAGLG